MSDLDPNENIDDDLTTYSVDDEDQLQPEDTLDDGDLEDVLDRGYSPNDRPQGVTAHGTTAYEESVGETIDERIRQEVPDPDSAYGAPDNESGLDGDRVGGDDPDAIDAEDDWLGDHEVGDARAGRLVADERDPADVLGTRRELARAGEQLLDAHLLDLLLGDAQPLDDVLDALGELLDRSSGVVRLLEVRPHPGPERLGLADVEHVARAVPKEIDARLRGEPFQLVFELRGHGASLAPSPRAEPAPGTPRDRPETHLKEKRAARVERPGRCKVEDR